ncbi:MAG: hypothetical protein HPY54_14605 [Chthonomonadetes bacterium]|nr:hypothetical protein [Chthonomonadetes bacterium]
MGTGEQGGGMRQAGVYTGLNASWFCQHDALMDMTSLGHYRSALLPSCLPGYGGECTVRNAW